MNKVTLIGNLTRDPEITTTTNGTSVARFSLAVPRKFRNESGEYEADFINIVAWGNHAELAHKYLSKGKRIALVGRLQSRTYEAPDGTKRYFTEVVLEEFDFLFSKNSDGDYESKEESVTKLEPIDDDDLPF